MFDEIYLGAGVAAVDAERCSGNVARCVAAEKGNLEFR